MNHMDDNKLYVCDSENHRIQVFDLNLGFIKSIGSRGQKNDEFLTPRDVKFDISGNMYVAEFGNKRVQVIGPNGKFIQEFGQDKLHEPSGLHIINRYLYVSDYGGNCILVYDTTKNPCQFVTSFGRHGRDEGEFYHPFYITSCVNGFIYICDCHNDRVQIF